MGLRPALHWERIDGGSGKFATWKLDDAEYIVEHCGHPTALRPWTAKRPDGSFVIEGASKGAAFQYLDDAKVACEIDLARTLIANEAAEARRCVDERTAELDARRRR